MPVNSYNLKEIRVVEDFVAFLLKTALIDIFILTINQMTLGNVKRVTRSDSAVPLSFHVFQLIVLVFQPATLMFWFSLTALIELLSLF